MRKLKRLNLNQLTDFTKPIPNKIQKNIIGGYGNNGDCFYNCLEYLNNKYQCHSDRDYLWYANDYVSGANDENDDWGGTATRDRNEALYGPNFVNFQANTLNNEPYSYLANNFSTEGSKWTVGENVQNLFGSSNGSQITIVGTFVSGSDQTHCAIFESYDAQSGLYTYFDPDTGSRSQVHSTHVVCAAKVSGCR